MRRVSANHSAPQSYMAVVNSPWVGISRGKLGEAVLYRAKGNTNARQYNPSPQNRRTVSQQAQRSLFSSAVKFFSRGVQNLFVFAYEDKRTQESDYNAFMRYNAKLGMFFGPEQNNNPAYPALGNWVLSHGSLQTVRQSIQDRRITANLSYSGASPSFETVAELSQALITGSTYMEGDIFTFLYISTNALAVSPSEPMTDYDSEPEWHIAQLILDSTDNRTLSSLDFRAQTAQDGSVALAWMGDTFADSVVEGYAVIHSRNTSGSLRVSDSTLLLSTVGGNALSFGRSVTWKSIVMAAWQTEQTTILQGGVAQRQSSVVVPNIALSINLPLDMTAGDSFVVYIFGNFTRAEIYQHLKFALDDGSILTPGTGGTDIVEYYLGADIYVRGVRSDVGNNTVLTLSIPADTEDFVLQSVYWDAG